MMAPPKRHRTPDVRRIDSATSQHTNTNYLLNTAPPPLRTTERSNRQYQTDTAARPEEAVLREVRLPAAGFGGGCRGSPLGTELTSCNHKRPRVSEQRGRGILASRTSGAGEDEPRAEREWGNESRGRWNRRCGLV